MGTIHVFLKGHQLATCSWEWLLCHCWWPALYWTGCQWRWDSHHLPPSTVCVNFWTSKSGCHCKHVCLNYKQFIAIGILSVEVYSTHQCSQSPPWGKAKYTLITVNWLLASTRDNERGMHVSTMMKSSICYKVMCIYMYCWPHSKLSKGNILQILQIDCDSQNISPCVICVTSYTVHSCPP